MNSFEGVFIPLTSAASIFFVFCWLKLRQDEGLSILVREPDSPSVRSKVKEPASREKPEQNEFGPPAGFYSRSETKKSGVSREEGQEDEILINLEEMKTYLKPKLSDDEEEESR